MFGTIKRWLFLKALSDIKKRKIPKAPLHQNPTQAIHILYEERDENDHLAVQNLIKQLKLSQKIVVTLAFLSDSTPLPLGTENQYNLKNVAFNNVPSGPAVQHFIEMDSDVLIVLTHHFHDHMRYITYACNSYFKIGLSFPKGENYFHAIMDLNPSQPYTVIIRHILNFMESFSHSK